MPTDTMHPEQNTSETEAAAPAPSKSHKRSRNRGKRSRNRLRYLAGFGLGVLATAALIWIIALIPSEPAPFDAAPVSASALPQDMDDDNRHPELSQAERAIAGRPLAPIVEDRAFAAAQAFATPPASSTGAGHDGAAAGAAPAAPHADQPPLPAEFQQIIDGDRQHPRSLSAMHDDFGSQLHLMSSVTDEQRLAQALAPLANQKGFHISSVVCRTTLCEVRAEGASSADDQMWWRLMGLFYSQPGSRGFGTANYAQADAPPKRYVLMLIGAPRR